VAETLTANYGWTKPDPGGSANTWGATLNATTDKIDAQVFQNQQAGVPLGSMTMWPTATPPANWLLCQGQSLATTGTYAALFAILGYAFGGSGANFNLPDLRSRMPMGAGTLAATGGAANVTLSTAQLPAHSHTITQVAHAHTASQPAHTHPDPGHAHSISDPGHAHGGVIVPGGQFSLGVSGGVLIGGPANTAGGATGITGTNGAVTGLQAAGADAVTVNATTPTGPTATGSVGSGAAVPTVPPYLTVNFIIKFA
jgi:microcystin-dependent protein